MAGVGALPKPDPVAGSIALSRNGMNQVKTDQANPDPVKTDQANAVRTLNGITLEAILNQLVQDHGWAEMARRIPLNCFINDPGVKSSLKFLRKTPWARKKVEDLYLAGPV